MTQGKETKYHFLEDLDLTASQIDETAQTYLHFAENYATLVERVADAAARIQSKTLVPFLAKYKELRLAHPILFVGAGSGRDMQTAESLGFLCQGIDQSAEMVSIARKFGVVSPYFVMDMRHIDLPTGSYGGIFCETALSHITKGDQREVLQHFSELLVPGGLVLLGIRIADGRVFYVDDEVGGRRYNTTMTQPESDEMIRGVRLHIISAPKYQITDRPAMIDYLLQKPL